MDKLQAMQVFAQVMKSRSFSRAAETLDLPRSSVSTAVQNLESLLKVRLLNRTTRSVSPTADGMAYYERCARILADLEATETLLTGAPGELKGRLRIEIPGQLGRSTVLPVLDDFQREYPNVELMLGFSQDASASVHGEADCIIYVSETPDPELVNRQLGGLRRITVASGAYLARYGVPESPQALREHIAVHRFSRATGQTVPWRFKGTAADEAISIPSALSADNLDACLDCGVRGLGLVQVPDTVAAPYLEAGTLTEVLAEWRPAALPVWLAYPQSRHLSPPVRVLVDWLAEHLDCGPGIVSKS